MLGEKIPIQSRKGTGVVTVSFGRIKSTRLAIVAHPLNVLPGGSIGFGSHDAAISILRHAQTIWQLHPLNRIDIHGQIPLMDLLGMNPQHHGE